MTTKKELIRIQDNINHVLENRGLDREVYVSYAYGQPRLGLWEKSSGNMLSDLSPRLSKSQLEDWMLAFYDGLTFQG